MIKVVDVLLASNYSVVALKLEGNQAEMCELGSKILGQNFKGGGVKEPSKKRKASLGFSVAQLIQANFESSEIICKNGKLVRKPGFKFGNCNLIIREGGKDVPISDSEKLIKLVARFVEGNSTVGFEVYFRNKKMNLSVANIIALCSVFKADGFTVAVKDGVVQKKDPKTGKVTGVKAKKPYLVGINGNRLSELPVVKIKSKKKDGVVTDKHRGGREVTVVDPKLVSLSKLIKVIESLNGLIVIPLPYANSGDSGYDDSKSRADMVFNPLAFDVCTPELIYEDGGLNIRLEAKRMGTVKYDNTECVPVFELHERPIYRDFKVALPRISVALKDTETQFKFFSKIGFASNYAHSSTGGSMLNSSELKLLENLKAIKKLPLYSYNCLNKDTRIYDYDVSNYSVIVDLDISKLLPTRVRCESIFNSELDIMESASRICKLQRQLAIVGSYCKKERIIPLAGNDFSSKEFLLRKPLSKIGVNPVTGEIGEKAKYPRVDGSIGIKFASKDRGATNIDEIVVSGQALDKAIERACELYRDSGKIDTVAESIRSAFIFGNDSDVDSVFCDGFNEKACNSIYVDLSSAKGFEILALFYLRKEIEKTKGKLYFNYLVYTVIANTKGRLNLELGKIAEYSLSRLIANRFKSFGNYDIDKEWALVADNGKSKVYEPSIGTTNLTMTLTGIELKKTASKDAMKSNDIIDFNMVPVTPNLNNPEAESLTRLFFKNIASLGDGKVLLINMDSKYKNYIKKDGDATVFSVGGIEVAQPVFKVGNDLSSTTLNLEFMRLGYIQTSGGKKLVSVPVTRCIFKDGKYTKLAQKLVLACSSSCTSKITELFSKSDDEEYKIFNEESLPSVVTGILRKFSSPNFPVASDGAFEYFTIDLSHTPITTSYGPFGVTEVSGARHIVVLRCRLDIFRTLYSGLSTELGKAGLAIDSEISAEEARKFGISLGERSVLNIEDRDSSPRRFLFKCSGLGNYSNLTSDFMRQMQESFDTFVGNGGGDDDGVRPSDTSDMPTEYALNYIEHMSKEIQADVENGGNKYTSKISERVMRAIKSLELWEACAAFYLYGFTIERKSNKFANILAALRECINCCEFGYSKLEKYREKDWLTAKYNINILYEAMEHLRKKGYIKIYKDKRLHITTDGKNKCTLGYTDKVENTREITIGLPFKMTDNEYDFS